MRNAVYTGTTILTQDRTPDPESASRERRVDSARRVAIDGWLQGYLEGEVDLHCLCRGIQRTVNACGLSQRTLESWLGHAVSVALSAQQPKKRSKGAFPTSLQMVAVDLANVFNAREKAPKSRGTRTKGTAYERAAARLEEVGVHGITPRQIELWESKLKAH